MLIQNSKDLREAVRQGSFAFPGGYPLFFLMADGECLHPETIRNNYRRVLRAVKYDFRVCDEWRAVGLEINYEDGSMRDAHNNRRIESAYGDKP